MAAADDRRHDRENSGSEFFVEDLLSRTVDQWDGYIAEYQAERAARGRPITWYEQPGLDKGLSPRWWPSTSGRHQRFRKTPRPRHPGPGTPSPSATVASSTSAKAG
ncbi:hypothetical protein ACFQ3Z_25865 [Streptomyces nogalater]